MTELNLEVIGPGPGRLIRALIDEIRIVETINAGVRWDETQWKISPGELIVAIMICIFCRRRALYKLKEFYAKQDIELLFGRKDITAADFNDDCLGRALDRLAESGFHGIFGAIVLHAKTAHDFEVGTCHGDTTSISVYGEYEVDEEPPLFLTYGHSTDKRPDLKQFKFGLLTNGEGIPIHGEPMNGNKSDKTWCQEIIKSYRDFKNVLAETILVADSAAMTGPNLRLIAEKELRVISRLPETFNLCGELKEEAWRLGAWVDAGRLAREEKAATYRWQCFERELEGAVYRFVVVNSSSLNKTKRKSIERSIAREEAELNKALKKLRQAKYACQIDAERAWERFLAEAKPRYHSLACHIVAVEEIKKRTKRGRPAKDEIRETERGFVLKAELVGRDEKAIAHAYDLARTFVLLSSVPPKEASPVEVLRHYKDQTYIENRFRFLKNPYFVGPVYLKKPSRVQALGYVLLLTLLIYSLFERRVRKGLLAENEPYHVAGSYRTYRPRGETLLEELDYFDIVWLHGPNGLVRIIPENVSQKIRRIIRLAGFDVSIYAQPP